jgi:hypothetical protein
LNRGGTDFAMKSWKTIVYLSLTIGLLLYALPRLSSGTGGAAETAFIVMWLVLAFVIAAAHLHEMFGMDEDTRKEAERVKRLRRQKLYQRGKM